MNVKNAFLNVKNAASICNLLPVSLLNQTRFVTFDVHFMAVNKLQELGLPSLAPPSFA